MHDCLWAQPDPLLKWLKAFCDANPRKQKRCGAKLYSTPAVKPCRAEPEAGKAGPGDALKPGGSGECSHCLGNLTEKIFRARFNSIRYSPFPVGLYI